ncbi:MAG: methyltransferase domain-containing protein [Pyrinomonadaceae bacterium]|nr:methyltransferase domain-containing protein [Pyrinomonadaceae bacterium]
MIDIGTGDGFFVSECARQNPRKFYIGIDANTQPLEKISEKIHRKPSKGGLPNVLFLQAAVEDLPPELDGVADEVHVHFPWGSLLGAVATGNEGVLRNLRRICSADALLEILIGFDPVRDVSELKRLEIPSLSLDYIDSFLAPRYVNAGFAIIERGVLPQSEWVKVQTSWARRLKGRAGRSLTYIIGRATDKSHSKASAPI